MSNEPAVTRCRPGGFGTVRFFDGCTFFVCTCGISQDEALGLVAQQHERRHAPEQSPTHYPLDIFHPQ